MPPISSTGAPQVNDLGGRYHRLLVVSLEGNDKWGSAKCKCKCDCGQIKVVRLSDLKNGKTTSCGCQRRQSCSNSQTKHGLSSHPVYFLWKSIKRRCYNKNTKDYINYGGRGITVCEEWRSDFMYFYNWALKNGWEKGLDIDRIDNDGEYSSCNCRFVDKFIGNNNRRNTVMITIDGVSENISYWARLSGVNRKLIHDRLTRKWEMKRAVFEKVNTA